jgi:hypothetical protein
MGNLMIFVWYLWCGFHRISPSNPSTYSWLKYRMEMGNRLSGAECRKARNTRGMFDLARQHLPFCRCVSVSRKMEIPWRSPFQCVFKSCWCKKAGMTGEMTLKSLVSRIETFQVTCV